MHRTASGQLPLGPKQSSQVSSFTSGLKLILSSLDQVWNKFLADCPKKKNGRQAKSEHSTARVTGICFLQKWGKRASKGSLIERNFRLWSPCSKPLGHKKIWWEHSLLPKHWMGDWELCPLAMEFWSPHDKALDHGRDHIQRKAQDSGVLGWRQAMPSQISASTCARRKCLQAGPIWN